VAVRTIEKEKTMKEFSVFDVLSSGSVVYQSAAKNLVITYKDQFNDKHGLRGKWYHCFHVWHLDGSVWRYLSAESFDVSDKETFEEAQETAQNFVSKVLSRDPRFFQEAV
jgi:hypothetical protein